MTKIQAVLAGVAGATLAVVLAARERQPAIKGVPKAAFSAAPAEAATPNWSQPAAAGVAIEEWTEPPEAGDVIRPPVTLDELLEELESDSAPDFAGIDRDAFEAQLMSDPVLRKYFQQAR